MDDNKISFVSGIRQGLRFETLRHINVNVPKNTPIFTNSDEYKHCLEALGYKVEVFDINKHYFGVYDNKTIKNQDR